MNHCTGGLGLPCGCPACQHDYPPPPKPREMVLDDIAPRVIDLGHGDVLVQRNYERAFK